MILLVLATIGGWEIYLRSKGITVSYDDGGALWSDKRAMVYEPADKTTVFIGSSRIKYDLDIPTWEKITGRHAVQLGVEGNTPVPTLVDLGNDPNFKGKLVVDVMEPLFFSPPGGGLRDVREFIQYYKKRTPAQWASFKLNHMLESQFVFLDKDFLSLNAKLDKLLIPNRPNVYFFPLFPMDFEHISFDRQNTMTPRFLADTSLQHQVKNIWLFLMAAGRNAPRPAVSPVPGIFQSVKEAVEKIKARGGDVVFVKPPVNGPFQAAEMGGFPRAKFWDPLLASTHCPGFFFTDNPETAHMICPEWSHLSPQDAVLYTKALIKELPKPFVQ
jgi:hypothetical protein